MEAQEAIFQWEIFNSMKLLFYLNLFFTGKVHQQGYDQNQSPNNLSSRNVINQVHNSSNFSSVKTPIFQNMIAIIFLIVNFFLFFTTRVHAGALSNQFTLSIWVNPSSSIASKALIDKDTEVRLVTDSSGDPQCQIYSGGSWQTAVTSSAALSLNTWSHVSCTYDKATIKVYVNGVQTGSGAQTNTLNDAATSLLVGQDDTATYGNFNGTTDQIQIYNYARAQKQIIEDMNAGHPAPGSPVGSPVGYWKFSEGYGTTTQNSGNGGLINGTLTNMNSPAVSTSGWQQDGKFGKAIAFDGTNDYITMSNPSALQIVNDLSISAFVNLRTNNAVHDIIAKNGASGSFGYRLYTDANGKASIQISQNGTATYTATSSSTLAINNWYHVVGTYSTSGALKVYINGRQEDNNTTSIPNSINNSSSNFLVGSENAGATNMMSGTIDEVKAYSGLLTQDQVKQEFNRGAAQVMGALSTIGATNAASSSASAEYCIPGDSSTCTAPVGRWNFEEGSGTTANDTSGNENNGTITPGAGGYTIGKVGKAYNFDAATTIVNAGSASSLDNLPASGITLEAWVYPKSSGEGSAGFILAKNVGTTVNTGWILQLTSGLALTFTVDGSTDLVRTTSTTLAQNAWNHITVSWDGVITTASSVNIYINGVLASYATTTNGASRVDDGTSTFYIGNDSTSARTFDGYIDQVRVFNYNRTLPQIAWDYNRAAPTMYLKMDECAGTTLNDSSGNSLSGSIYTGGSNVGTCATSGQWANGATGKYNASFDFDGTNDVATVSANTKIDLNDNLAASHSFSAWIYPNTAGEGSGGEVYWKGATTFLRVDTLASGRLDVEAQLDLSTTDATLNISSAIPTNTWSQIVVTYTDDSDDEITIYINGINRGSSTNGSGSPAAESNNLLIGGPATDNFDGQIDDFKIFNYELNATQVKTLYNSGAVRFGPVTGSP